MSFRKISGYRKGPWGAKKGSGIGMSNRRQAHNPCNSKDSLRNSGRIIDRTCSWGSGVKK